MQIVNGRIVSSATDLTNFLACGHLTNLDLAAARGELARPSDADPLLKVLTQRGTQHELRYLGGLRDQGTVVEIQAKGYGIDSARVEHDETIAAMRGGAPVINQGTFFDGDWLGHADFLFRVEKPSALGGYSYEVADAKLARHAKVPALLQMCAYSAQLSGAQGTEPEHMHVVVGTMKVEPHRLKDYSAYYRSVRARFQTAITNPHAATYPEPVAHCAVCCWQSRCKEQWRKDDHLSIVANMRRDQTRKLAAAGIPTVSALASTQVSTVKGIGRSTFQRLRRQATLQKTQRDPEDVHYQLLELDGADRGLSSLPLPSPADLFFDMEGDPFAEDGGLEYLFGVVEVMDSKPIYHRFWAHDRLEERHAFEQFIDFVMARLDRTPNLHIYHYASYEPDRLNRLMGLHATREEEVDRLLRGGVLVDLYRVVTQSMLISQESYSIKKLEPLYMDARETAIKEGGSSVVSFEQWLESGKQGLLDEIEAYNRDDCVSTWKLRGWLEERRAESERQFGDLPRPEPRSSEASETQAAAEARTAQLVALLAGDVPEDSALRSAEQCGRWLLAQLLGWHRREARPEWWSYFERLPKSEEELFEDSEAIGGLDCQGVAGQEKQSLIHRYSFDPEQDHKILVGMSPHDPSTKKSAGRVVAVDNTKGILDLVRGQRSPAPHPLSVVPPPPLDTKVLRDAIARVAESVTELGLDADGRFRAVLDLLLRQPPRIAGLPAGARLACEDEPGHDTARRLVLDLDRSYLAIQGPPGSGKTYTGARMILDLLRAHKRVGITANSHKAIGNLLEEVSRAAKAGGVELRALQKAEPGDACAAPDIGSTDANDEIEDAIAGGTVDLVAGTPWLFARQQLAGTLDALFVDEAGQMSLANVVAMAGAAQNLVLLGDPQQLPQVTKGLHPLGAEKSALGHLLGAHATIPEDKGIFLSTTWRLHPDICGFISEIAYEDRLQPDSSCAQQSILGTAPVLKAAGAFTGLRYLPVAHQANRTSSFEEVGVVDSIMQELLAANWIDARGSRRRLLPDDVLVVAPYNAQVARLSERLGDLARVGTVDKFQGQEGAAVIYSLATSSAEDLPRTLEFLYDLNRLNVAISRARALAVLVCSPTLLAVRCATVQQMRLVNALCRFVELGTAGAE